MESGLDAGEDDIDQTLKVGVIRSALAGRMTASDHQVENVFGGDVASYLSGDDGPGTQGVELGHQLFELRGELRFDVNAGLAERFH